ncbi:MAG: hypothetical protein MUE53_09935 [Chitinophagales bacterium]|nr:hypothetical protein [Chitinophagales bacterium]
MKQKIAEKIKAFIYNGGFLFAMCSATDTYDIALAAHQTDICHEVFDGDPIESDFDKKLNFDNALAFQNYQLVLNPYEYEHSSIDRPKGYQISEDEDFFLLFEFSAKWDQIPTILTQNHSRIIKGFMGQTTGFQKQYIKSNSLILGENAALQEARYIHGTLGKGMWSFYSGHDPEDYQHFVYEPKTELSEYPNSPGYRIILNNILFPAAKRKKQKT